MKPFPKLPNPHTDFTGRGFVERKAREAFSRMAKLWTPRGEENEPTHCTVSRYAQQLIDRATGKAYSADEISSKWKAAAYAPLKSGSDFIFSDDFANTLVTPTSSGNLSLPDPIANAGMEFAMQVGTGYTVTFTGDYMPTSNGTEVTTQADTDGIVQYHAYGSAWRISRMSLSELSQSSATSGQVATWNGSAWEPATVNGNRVLAVGTKSKWYGDTSGGLSNGTTDLGETSRTKHYANENCDRLQLVYGNMNPSGTAAPNTISVRASIEYSGVIYPVYFDGVRTVQIAANGIVTSDPQAYLYIPKNSTYYVRTYVSVTSGEKWPRNFRYTEAADQVVVNQDYADVTTTVTGIGQMFGPMATFGQQRVGQPRTIAICGDSISQGFGVTAPGVGPFLAAFDGTSLGSDFGKGVATLQLGLTGETAAQFGAAATRMHRQLLLGASTHVIYQYGINDVRGGSVTFSSIQATTQAIWNMMQAMGLKIYACTLTPNTTSTDSWATTGNQTLANTTGNTVRVAYNDWLRTIPSPLSGIIETADTCETSRNSGIWKAGYTGDGLHPNATGFAAYKAVISEASIR